MKCYLEMVGVVSTENDVAIKQAMSHFSTSDDIINNCLKEQSEIGINAYNIFSNISFINVLQTA